MHLPWKKAGLATLLIGLAAGIGIGLCLSSGPGIAQDKVQKDTPAHRYTVVSSEGTNLIVVDNQKHTLLFYTVDHGAEPGADLKLRGTVDLTRVGEEVLKPKLYRKKEKKSSPE